MKVIPIEHGEYECALCGAVKVKCFVETPKPLPICSKCLQLLIALEITTEELTEDIDAENFALLEDLKLEMREQM